jgi:hypothetical protein
VRYLRERLRHGNAVLALVALPLMIAVGTMSLAGIAHAAKPSHPACRASQIKVTTGATVMNTTYAVRTSTGVHQSPASEVVPVYFYNRGAICHLPMGAPVFDAVRNTDSFVVSTNDIAIPGGADNNRRPVINHHQRLQTLFVVVKPKGSLFAGCDPEMTTGFIVGDYGKPITTSHFVVRKLHDVCFDTGVGRAVLNYGAIWPVT